jgi:hypothetical protein
VGSSPWAGPDRLFIEAQPRGFRARQKRRRYGFSPALSQFMYLRGAYLAGVCVMGVHLMGVHLIGVHLMGVYLMGVYLMGV